MTVIDANTDTDKMMVDPLVCPWGTTPSLALLGGKGKSLASLIQNGFPVPAGFHVTTASYRAFVESMGLEQVLSVSQPTLKEGLLDFIPMADAIGDAIRAADIPNEIADEILKAWQALEDGPLAVRSSATAEDLPDLSFAGQQDTYLNINGEVALLEAVRNCWASLWNDRAISYRYQMGIDHASTLMAIVVQRMIPADVSGVLFTANPATGDREQCVLNASFGLGESIVSGTVTPDSYVVNRKDMTVVETVIGSKTTKVVANDSNGVQTIDTSFADRDASSLSDAQIRELIAMAVRVESYADGQPQDIEWLFAGDELWLLQSRPITRLPPPPLQDVRWDPPEPSAFLGRSQLVEHIPDPVSTLFEDLHMRQSLQHFWGMNLVRRGRHDYADSQPPASFVVQTTVNGYAYRHLGEPPRSGRLPERASRLKLPDSLVSLLNWWRGRWQTFRIWILWIPEWRWLSLPRYLRETRRWGTIEPTKATTEQLWAGIRALSFADARYWYQGGVWNAFSLTRGTEFSLSKLLIDETDGQLTSGQFLSGLKSPAFDAHVALWRIARHIQESDTLMPLALRTSPVQLVEALKAHPDASAPCRMLADYLRQYGHQIFNLDFADASEGENPEFVSRALHAQVLQQGYDPLANQRELARKRRESMAEALRLIPRSSHWDFRKALWQARHYYPNRELAMFHMGKAWTVLRPFAKELGRRLSEAGTLTCADDVFFLTTDELGRAIRALLAGDGIGECAVIATRRRELREARRQLTPPMHVGKVPFWLKDRVPDEPEASEDGSLSGSAVSPGQVTGPASLVLSPADFDRMKPGSILVCPATTPAWTQLFPRATGLVTDIGGILAHGSIVAREYGIPAVLGIGNATVRIRDGQMLTVDGNRGTVAIHDESDDSDA